jgi:hypothetical protein
VQKLVLIGTYLPCFVNTDDYEVDIMLCVGFIESILGAYGNIPNCSVILLGDFNFECEKVRSSPRLGVFLSLLNDYGFKDCDNMDCNHLGYTYYQGSMQHYSCIDHMFVTNNLINLVTRYEILDVANNISDHCPVSMNLNVELLHNVNNSVNQDEHRLPRIAWTPGVISKFGELTNELLSVLRCPDCCNISFGRCADTGRREQISKFCNDLVNVLTLASSQCAVSGGKKANKPFWSVELSKLKMASVEAHTNWVNGKRPRNGSLHEAYVLCKAKYKKGIRSAKRAMNRQADLLLVDALSEGDSKSFWTRWNKQFGTSCNNVTVISGKSTSQEICDGFAAFFQGNFKRSDDCVRLKNSFIDLYDRYVCNNSVNNDVLLTVDDIEHVIKNMKKGKSAGYDELLAEHVKYAGGRLLFMLTKLFNMCLVHGFVPDNFAVSIIVPVPKDNGNKCDDFDGYRPVSLVSIFSKIFESCLLEKLGKFLFFDELQFGFTPNKGCQKAILLMNCVTDHFNKAGSNVYTAALDISKAFDGVNHYGLFIKMMDVGMPLNMLNVFINWYCKLKGKVRWSGCVSYIFDIKSGVREGGVASPALFNMYINGLIIKLRASGFGCYLGSDYVGCILFADDILLLSASVVQLQNMLNICFEYSIVWDMKFNAKKCALMYIGYCVLDDVPVLHIGGDELSWVKKIKYLGLIMQSEKELTVDVNVNCRKFLGACFGMFQRCGALSEPVLCELVLKKCLPILVYGTECIRLKTAQKQRLNVAFNTVIRRVFKLSKYTSVKNIIFYIGGKPVKILLDERRCLLIKSCLDGSCGLLRKCARLVGWTDDFMRIRCDYGVHESMTVSGLKKCFYEFVKSMVF